VDFSISIGAWQELVFAYLFIFIARVADMSLDVVRMLMLMRGQRLLAAFIGFMEVSIFVVALNEVIKGGLDDPGKIIAYAGGFATGNLIGSIIEEKMALGHLVLQVFPHFSVAQRLVERFREEGFGVTKVSGEGRSGPRPVLYVILQRKSLYRALQLMDEIAPDIFYNVSDTRMIHGGIFPPKRKGK